MAQVKTITATERLARSLRIEHNLACRHDRAGWEAADIVSLTRFIKTLWLEQWPAELPVTPAQEAGIVRRIIARSNEGAHILNPAPTARLVQKALSLASHYRLDLRDPALSEQAEYLALRQWDAQVHRDKQRRQWVTQDDMLRQSTRMIREGKALSLPHHIRLVGFVTISPLQRGLLDALEEAGVEIDLQSPDLEAEPSYRLARDETAEAELRRVARQIRQILSAHHDDPRNAPKIAVVLPDVERPRQRVDKAFREALAPHAIWPEHADIPVPWQWMKGIPLSQHPIADAALQILGLRNKVMPLDATTALLLNRHIGNLTLEHGGRARIDHRLRTWGNRFVQSKALISLAVGTGDNGMAPELGQRLVMLGEHLQAQNAPATPSVWAQRFRERLAVMGWPGSESLSSEGYQAQESFKELLNAFACMDHVLGKVPSYEALGYLEETISTHPFMARSSHLIPVEIMDIWDIAGHHYDHAFVIGMTMGVLPQKASPNPFLPYEMQKTAGVPTCCADTQLASANILKGYLSELSEDTVVSCPLLTEDGYHLTPSLILGEWPEEVSEQPVPKPEHQLADLEWCESTFPPVNEEELPHLRGGVKILAAYARTPFFAAAEARLHLEPFPQPTEGISASVQGNILHRAMDAIWRVLGDSETLQSKLNSLDGVIRDAIEEAFADPKVVPPYSLGRQLIKMEKDRVFRVVKRWMLGVEARRTEPFEVIEREVLVESYVAGLPGKLRIDRIDRVHTADGDRHLILDYKTGASVNVTGWHVDSLVEPQLPIYATSVDLTHLGITHPDGIGFAHLTDSECKAHVRTCWTGSLTDDRKDGLIADWDGQLDAWRAQLQSNAGNFLAGHAEADYLSVHKHEITHGHLFGLLRRQEA